MNDAGTGASGGDTLRRTVTICNERGLHARAAAKFVKLADGFEARITVTRGGISVSGRSIMGLMMLAAAPGCDIEIEATGGQAQAALDALAKLVEAQFGET